MGNPLDVQVTLFSGALGIDPIGEPTVRDLIATIRSGKYKDVIEDLRNLRASGDKPAYEEAKKKLPGFTLSARLKTRSSKIPLPEKLIAHTHLLQIDIDEIPTPGIEFLEARLRNDPVVLFSFRSPSGDSLKVGIRIDGTRHHESYLSAEKYFLDKYGVKIDPKVKEVPRLCFVSYDPNPFINENAIILPIVPISANGKKSTTSSPDLGGKPSHGKRAMTAAQRMIERSVEGEKLNDLLKASKLLGGYVAGRMLSRSDAENCLRNAIENKDGVNNLQTAHKAIASGLDFGEQLPIDFEDLERERLGYLNQKYPNSKHDKSDKSDKSDVADSIGQVSDINRTSVGQVSDINIANLRSLVKVWVDESPGIFNTSEIDRELGLKSRQEKKNRSDALADLVREGILDRDLNRRGVFRKKNTDLCEMDIIGAKTEELPISLPFGLNRYIEINPKEIILFMGESNSGKTTVMFNMIWSNVKCLKSEGCLRLKSDPRNTGMFGIRYFSSEMGPTGVRKKLLAFGEEYPLSEWVKYVSSVERNRDFQDVVDPCGLNFIDYLEVFDGEYFKLSSSITSIHAALKSGIAVIALQKKRGTDIGRGGEATLEKPRLAIALSENKDRGYATAKIVKAKHYRDMNPTGLEMDFIIRRKGTKIIHVSEWDYESNHRVRRNSMNYHNWNNGE